MRKPVRSVTKTIRATPRNDFLIEIAARVQRRTNSSFIENAAVEFALSVKLHDGRTVRDIIDKAWHVDRSERLKRLYEIDRSLLTYSEECELVGKEKLNVS